MEKTVRPGGGPAANECVDLILRDKTLESAYFRTQMVEIFRFEKINGC
jgi:hypothetical protein